MTTQSQESVDNESLLRLRIVNLDYYMCEPNVTFDDLYSVFRQNEIKRVPVLRIFGATDRGVKTCLHVHRVYPYLSVRFDVDNEENYEFKKQKFMTELVNDLEKRLLPNRVRTRNNLKESPNDHLIYDIKEVNAIPFYGFHENYQKFLRIYFYNPSSVQKVSELLLSGQIMDRQIQPFEGHIPFTLQFLIDNNLYGMNFLSANKVYYRKKESLDNNLLYSDIEPMSSSQMECDIDFNDILNRNKNIKNERLPGLEAIWTEELKRCNNSQELLNLKGVASQDRSNIPSNNLEAIHMKRLFEGLSKLNLKLENNQNLSQSQQMSSSSLDESDFAQLMVQCIEDKDYEISQTIEEVVNNSQSFVINQIIEDVIIDSQNSLINETIENVITEKRNSSQRLNKNKSKPKSFNRNQNNRRLNLNNSLEDLDEEVSQSTEISDISQKNEENTDEYEKSLLYVDAGTQTEINDVFDESVNSMFGFNEEIEEIVCDCDSDECCDQCCDRRSDQCECDCEKCESEKCKRIPQLDGAFDSDDSGSNFSPAFKDDSGDSDFEVTSKKKRGSKRTKSKSTPTKRKKSKLTAASDDSDVEEIAYSPKTRRSPNKKGMRQKSTSSDDFGSTSKGKNTKLFDFLNDKFQPKTNKSRSSVSPIRASFSESDGGSEKGGSGLLWELKDYSSTTKTNDDNRSDRSLTPYLSHESEDEVSHKKPGPQSSKAYKPGPQSSKANKPGPQSSKSNKPGPQSSKAYKPGPKSSKSEVNSNKPGPKSSKTTAKAGPKSSKTSKPGPKCSKISKPGPLSSKKRNSTDNEIEDYMPTMTTSRSRRSIAKNVSYDDSVEKITYEEPSPKKTVRSNKRKSGKTELESAISSISQYLPNESTNLSTDLLTLNQNLLSWKSINSHLIQIDEEFYGSQIFESFGRERQIELKLMPDYIIGPYLRRYEQNIDYWQEVSQQIEAPPKSGTRSKGALKDFYTLPHLNERKTSEKAVKAQSKPKMSPKKSNSSKEFARLINDASDILDKPLTKRGVTQTKSKKKEKVVYEKPLKSLPKRSNSFKAKSSSAQNERKTNAINRKSRLSRGVTTSTIFDSINIPFYDSDIKVVTHLSGHKKKAHLLSLCYDFELQVSKLPQHYLQNYLNHNISPLLFDNIYYNDYSGYLPDEQSQDTQDVLITVKNLINEVVSISQCVDTIINDVSNEFEPKPMIDTREEDYFEETPDVEPPEEWNYYEEEENGVVGVTAFDDNYEVNEMSQQNISINSTNDTLNDILLKSFTENEEENEVTSDQQIGVRNENKENDNNENQSENGSQNDPNDGEDNEEENIEEERNEYQYPNNYNDCPQEEEDIIDNSYENSAQQYSPPLSHEYSNQSNGHFVEQNSPQYQQQYEEDEEEDEEEVESENSNICSDNVMIGQSVDDFKSQGEYNNEMYGFDQNQELGFPQNPLQNPIVPTLHPDNHSYHQNSNLFNPSHQWSQSLSDITPHSSSHPPQYSPTPTLSQSQGTPQPDNEFDVSNYNYMSYYSNQNIPQFDGIFDDDDFQTVGKPFNMKCSSDETIEQLSQGSRSEEASPKKHATDIVAEALRAGNKNAGLREKSSAVDKRYGYYISGVVVKIPKSLPEQCLQQLGREVVSLDRLMDSTHTYSHILDEFTEDDRNSFLKTSLSGTAKLKYLQSLCNKNIKISLKRLNINELKIHLKSNSYICVSSFINKSFISLNNNKRLCIESNESESNALSKATKCLSTAHIEINEIPESPLNESSKSDEMVDEIYSFYSDNTLSSNSSQITQQSSQKWSQVIDELPNSGSSQISHKQHSTPMNCHKFKPFSQILSETQKALNLSIRDSPNSSFDLFSGLSPNVSSKPVVKNRERNYLRNDSIIEGPTPSTTFDYEFSSVTDSPVGSDYEYQYITAMSVEIHVSTRAKLNPDPKTDAIQVLFYSISYDSPSVLQQSNKYITGIIAVDSEIEVFDCSSSFNVIQQKKFRSTFNTIGDFKGVKIDLVDDELCLLTTFVDIVKKYDPDIILGYKVDTLSWGYIIERANVLNMFFLVPLSRINETQFCRNVESAQNKKCELTGRITLNLWTILRNEVTLNQYSYENCHYHILHERIPSFSFEKLTQLYANPLNPMNRRRVIDYYLRRTIGSLRMLDKLDFIGKTSELARLFGIQFHEVFNRGTQFRVESILLRFTRLMDYIPISPSHQQVASQRAPEMLPLILEPESKYYTDPIVVLDFQSLYPSMMIAYNYCYSTCLGRVEQLIRGTDFINLGCFELEMNKKLVLKYKNDLHISPNGVVFLKSNVRKGILPRMLEEILETRVMVKNAMKINNKKNFPNKGLNRKLDARQLGLKLIANVTYGYTNANYFGRMPCIDIADSIVAKGRETLEKAINLVRDNKEWGAQVVYGDTDSLFLHFKGISKEEAFRRGHEIAEVVTQQNPKPVRLKFEKVYLPSVLETKKRYVGFAYETPEQQTPIFDAKGIETVRRDTCPAVSKMLEKSLRILFQTNDLNGVKHYLMRQFQKILNGRISILEDFVFAREYRGAQNYSSRRRVPSAEIAKKRAAVDPRSEPKIKERVPYVVIAGPPNEQLYKLVKEPLDLIKDPSLRLNSQYYIEKAIIPALNRVFQLMGEDVNKWYKEMPKKIQYQRYHYMLGQESKAGRKTIPQFFNMTQCCVCGENSKGSDVCDYCLKSKSEAISSISDQIRDIHFKYISVYKTCMKCSATTNDDIRCQSIECPNLFRYHQSKLDLMSANYLTNVVNKYF